MGYDFAYGNTRIRAMKTRLLSKEDLAAAVRCKDLRAFVALLEHTPYKEVMSELRGYGKREVEKALFRQLTKELEKLEEMAPDEEHDIFEALHHKYEIENVKAVLAAKIDNVEREKIREGLPFPLGKHDIVKQLIESDLDKCIELLEKNGYELGEAYAIYKEKKVPHILLVALDRSYYTMLWKTLNKRIVLRFHRVMAQNIGRKLGEDISDAPSKLQDLTSGILESNRAVVRDLVGMEMDFVNFVNILRAKKYGYDVKVVLLPQYNLSTKRAASIGENELFTKMAQRLYRGSIEKNEDLAVIEKQVKRYTYNNYRRIFRSDVLGVGPFLAYLKIKEQEVWNLVAICNSVGVLEEKEIEELLL